MNVFITYSEISVDELDSMTLFLSHFCKNGFRLLGRTLNSQFDCVFIRLSKSMPLVRTHCVLDS